jgi:CelD/BcsL family acetyltransferase involved in cellulose biosynthesis
MWNSNCQKTSRCSVVLKVERPVGYPLKPVRRLRGFFLAFTGLKTNGAADDERGGDTSSAAQMTRAGSRGEELFYAERCWGYDPVPTLKELFERLREELGRVEGLPRGWQREEGTRNVFLFVCAIGCTVDDLLAPRAPGLSGMGALARQCGTLLHSIENLWRRADAARRQLFLAKIARWGDDWKRCVDDACTLAAAWPREEPAVLDRLRTRAGDLAEADFLRAVLGARMTVPTGLLSQDLTERDALFLAERFLASGRGTGKSLLVVGPRTAGAYFAPLVTAYFRLHGVQADWLTVRPKRGLALEESRRLRTKLRCRPHLVVVDDNPDTGETMRLLVSILAGHGVPRADMTLLVPLHPVNPRWSLEATATQAEQVATITLAPEDGFKARFLDSPEIEPLLREYCLRGEGEALRLKRSPELDELNARLAHDFGGSFRVRRKRVYEVERSRPGGETESFRVLAKSAGCGWLSYPSYFAGKRMNGFVPEVYGLRNGLLFQRWEEGEHLAPADRADPRVRSALVSYIAERVTRLALPADPYSGGHDGMWSGWEVLSRILTFAYDPRLRRPAVRRMRALLRRYASPCPTFIDGNMLPCDWICTADGLRKVDFASHAFGKTELNVCDPAYDLAMTLAAFELPPADRAEMLSAYRRLTGDEQVEERLVLHRMLYAAQLLDRATNNLEKRLLQADRRGWHSCAVRAKETLGRAIEEFCVPRWLPGSEMEWTSRLLFLDLDGVLYKWRTGFPIVTRAGLEALTRLRAHGFSILPNSRRGAEAVRRCCQLYGFPAGVAEFGSALLDLKGNREIALASQQALAEIGRCRQMLAGNDEMLLDPDFRYSIRVSRIAGAHTMGLSAEETMNLLRRNGCGYLTFLTTSQDTYITDKEVNKGTGAAAAKRILGLQTRQVIAIGDLEEDLSMLQASDSLYMVGQSSPAAKRRARALGCRVLSRPAQKGLAEAVRDILSKSGESTQTAGDRGGPAAPAHLLVELLEVADWPGWRQLLSLVLNRTKTVRQDLHVPRVRANADSGQTRVAAVNGPGDRAATPLPAVGASNGNRAGAAIALRGQSGLALLLPGWLAAEAASTFDPMQHASWTECWAECYNRAEQACFLTVGPPENPTAIAPLVESRVGGVERLMQAGVRDLFEPMGFPLRDPSAVNTLAERLIQFDRPLLFERVWADSPIIAALRRASEGYGWFFCRPARGTPFIPLDSSWQSPESHLNAGRRSDLRRARRRAEEAGPVRFEVLSPRAEELEHLLEEAYQVEAAGWKGEGGSALHVHSMRGAFYRRYATAMCRAGKLRLAFLRVGERAAAMQLAVETAGGFWLLKVGYDEAFARCSPGMLLMQETIRYSACQGLRTYEFLGTDEGWTQLWTREVRACSALRFYPHNAKGLAAFASDICRWCAERARRKLRKS